MQNQSLAKYTYSALHAYGMHEALEMEELRYRPGAPQATLTLAPIEARVLIVNEDIRSAAALRRTLHDLGYRTTLIAYSAKRALAAAGDFSPSIVLVDLELPDMSGFQLATKLQAHTQCHVRRVPLVAIAESAMRVNRERARAGGFIDCLTKPVLPLKLSRLLHTLWD